MKRHLLILKILVGLVVSIMVLVSDFSIAMAYEKEIKTISFSIAESVTAAGKKTVAVVDFTDLQGNVTELGRFLAEEISVDLTIATKGFEVIDRTHLNSVMKEHELAMLGITDPKKIKKLGEVAGVDAIVTGSVTPFGDSIRITCKVIATDTARTIGASKGDIAKTKAIEELLARGIETQNADLPVAQKTPQVKAESKKDMPFFENDFLKITVKSLQKTGKTLKLSLLYENISDKDVGVQLIGSETFKNEKHLIDENGVEWALKEAENIANYPYCASAAYTDLPPKLPKLVKLTFSPNNESNGSVFNAVLNHCCSGEECKNTRKNIFKAFIRNIKVE